MVKASAKQYFPRAKRYLQALKVLLIIKKASCDVLDFIVRHKTKGLIFEVPYIKKTNL